MGEDWDFGQPSVDASLDELIAELRTHKKCIKSAAIGSKQYKTLDLVIEAYKAHPLQVPDKLVYHLLELDIIPLIDFEGRYYFAVMYEGKSAGTTRSSSNIIVNLEDNLFARDSRFNYDNARLILLKREEYQAVYQAVQGGPVEPAPRTEVKKPLVQLDPIHKLIYKIVSTAVAKRATDIHFERVGTDNTRIRYRIDGHLVVYDDSIEPDLMRRVTSAIKTMAEVKSYDPLDPQDGVITFKPQIVELFPNLKDYSLRLSTVPVKCDAATKEVDCLALRLHEAEIGRHTLGELGFPPEVVRQIYSVISASQGLMLVTGPTGSGKTTTLYSILDHLNKPERNILTIEDPIEAFIPGLNQSQVNKERGWTFEKVMRHYLRQDPNVILVGETRDEETAKLLFSAAETGHFVFSTVHTNSAYDTLTRVFELGIAPTYVVSSLSAVLSQRLARLLCTDCKKDYDATAQIEEIFRTQLSHPLVLYRPGDIDCKRCHGTGYYGRIAVPELWVLDEEARDMVAAGEKYTSRYRQAAQKKGAKTLMQNGLELVLAGKTSLPEIARLSQSGLYYEKAYLLPTVLERQKG